MAQGGLKAVNKKAKNKVEKPKTGAIKKAPKKHNLHAKHAAVEKVSKVINKNIEQQIIERMNKEKPGALNILKEQKLRPGDSIERRKKLMREVDKVKEAKN